MSGPIEEIGVELMAVGELLHRPLGDRVQAGFALEEAAKACEQAARALRTERAVLLASRAPTPNPHPGGPESFPLTALWSSLP